MRVSNQVAVTMYEKLGYSVYRRVLEYYSGDVDEDAFGKFFSVCLSVFLPICSCQRVCLPACLFLSVFLPISVSAHASISVCLPACLPVGLSDINDTTVLQVVSTSGIYSLLQAGLQNKVENAVLAC